MIEYEGSGVKITCDKCGTSQSEPEILSNDNFYKSGWRMNPRGKKYTHMCEKCVMLGTRKTHVSIKHEQAQKLPPRVETAIRDIVWMARRYAEGRMTGAPALFNSAYNELRKHIYFEEEKDPDNRTDDSRPIKNFPLATPGE